MIICLVALRDGDTGNVPLFETLLGFEGEFGCFGIRPNSESMTMAFIGIAIPECLNTEAIATALVPRDDPWLSRDHLYYLVPPRTLAMSWRRCHTVS